MRRSKYRHNNAQASSFSGNFVCAGMYNAPQSSEAWPQARLRLYFVSDSFLKWGASCLAICGVKVSQNIYTGSVIFTAGCIYCAPHAAGAPITERPEAMPVPREITQSARTYSPVVVPAVTDAPTNAPSAAASSPVTPDVIQEVSALIDVPIIVWSRAPSSNSRKGRFVAAPVVLIDRQGHPCNPIPCMHLYMSLAHPFCLLCPPDNGVYCKRCEQRCLRYHCWRHRFYVYKQHAR